MVNTDRLQKAIRDFEFSARPSATNSSAACTAGDLNRIIDKISKVLKTFVDELEKNQ